jgi:cytoskeletal protein CcmA (bactofilin family)
MLYRAAAISHNVAPWAVVPNPTAVERRIEDFMLDQRVDAASPSVPDQVRQAQPGNTPKSSVSAVGAQSTIGKTLFIKGEITGSESVHIEGKVEGSIVLPGDRVTVGRDGRVSANIEAQDIVVLGEVLGSCNAGDHLNIRRDGSLCGDVVVSRISIEEGAYLTGSIDIRRQPVHEAVEHDLQVEYAEVN